MNYKLTGHHLYGITAPEDILAFYKKMHDNKASVKYLTKSITDFARDLVDLSDIDKKIDDSEYVDDEDVEFIKQRKISDSEYTKLAARQISKFKGDLFELFCEIFFAINCGSPHYGVMDYKFNCVDDYGVDAYAKNPNGDNTVIQIKFRSNPIDEIFFEDMSKTFTQGFTSKHLTDIKPKTLWLITNCNGANWRCDKVFGNMLHVINREHINTMISGNLNFWKVATDIIEYNIAL